MIPGTEGKNSLEKFASFLNYYGSEERYAMGYIGVVVKLPNQDRPELIVNLPESMPTKVNYYLNAYNPDLTLKTNPQVQILGYGWHLEFEDLEDLLSAHLDLEEEL